MPMIYSPDFVEVCREYAKDGKILVYGRFTSEMRSVFEECVYIAEKALSSRKKRWCKIVIDSPGGEVNSLTAMKDIMNSSSLKFYGKVRARAFSCGMLLLQNCHWRTAVSDASLLFHYGSSSISNSEFGRLRQGDNSFVDFQSSRLNQMISEVSQRTGLPAEKLDELALADRNLTPIQALELGFLDEVLSHVKVSEKPHPGEIC